MVGGRISSVAVIDISISDCNDVVRLYTVSRGHIMYLFTFYKAMDRCLFCSTNHTRPSHFLSSMIAFRWIY